MYQLRTMGLESVYGHQPLTESGQLNEGFWSGVQKFITGVSVSAQTVGSAVSHSDHWDGVSFWAHVGLDALEAIPATTLPATAAHVLLYIYEYLYTNPSPEKQSEIVWGIIFSIGFLAAGPVIKGAFSALISGGKLTGKVGKGMLAFVKDSINKTFEGGWKRVVSLLLGAMDALKSGWAQVAGAMRELAKQDWIKKMLPTELLNKLLRGGQEIFGKAARVIKEEAAALKALPTRAADALLGNKFTLKMMRQVDNVDDFIRAVPMAARIQDKSIAQVIFDYLKNGSLRNSFKTNLAGFKKLSDMGFGKRIVLLGNNGALYNLNAQAVQYAQGLKKSIMLIPVPKRLMYHAIGASVIASIVTASSGLQDQVIPAFYQAEDSGVAQALKGQSKANEPAQQPAQKVSFSFTDAQGQSKTVEGTPLGIENLPVSQTLEGPGVQYFEKTSQAGPKIFATKGSQVFYYQKGWQPYRTAKLL